MTQASLQCTSNQCPHKQKHIRTKSAAVCPWLLRRLCSNVLVCLHVNNPAIIVIVIFYVKCLPTKWRQKSHELPGLFFVRQVPTVWQGNKSCVIQCITNLREITQVLVGAFDTSTVPNQHACPSCVHRVVSYLLRTVWRHNAVVQACQHQGLQGSNILQQACYLFLVQLTPHSTYLVMYAVSHST